MKISVWLTGEESPTEVIADASYGDDLEEAADRIFSVIGDSEDGWLYLVGDNGCFNFRVSLIKRATVTNN